MKLAHYGESSGKLLGWYDEDIHDEIPQPTLEVSEEAWEVAINNDNAVNYVDLPTGSVIFKEPSNYKIDVERNWRDEELTEIIDPKQLVLIWADMTAQEQEATSNYRRLLLDYPQTVDFPNGLRPEYI